MHKRYMYAFQLVLHIERPVGVYIKVAGKIRAKNKLCKWHKSQTLLYIAYPLVKATGWIERDKAKRTPAMVADFGQMVFVPGKVLDVFKARCGLKLPIKIEAATMITAAQRAALTALLHQDSAAVRADIGETGECFALSHQQ